jgi:hypothetical protein
VTTDRTQLYGWPLGAMFVLAGLLACGDGQEDAGQAARSSESSAANGTGAAPSATGPVRATRRGLELTTPRELVTRDGAYRVTWRPKDDFVPVNEPFELLVSVRRNDGTRAPVTGATVEVDCQMPDHGHGMLREPRATELDGGEYAVRGMLLHMDGHWTVAVTVLVDGLASTADDVLDL